MKSLDIRFHPGNLCFELCLMLGGSAQDSAWHLGKLSLQLFQCGGGFWRKLVFQLARAHQRLRDDVAVSRDIFQKRITASLCVLRGLST